MILGTETWLPTIIYLSIYLLILVVPFWFIFKKAGFTPWLSLLMVVPLVNLIAFCYLAFAPWPVHQTIPAMPQQYN